DMTIRRDLDVLAEQGLVEKVHGGATLPSARRLEEPGFEAKSARAPAEKQAIAAAAARLASPGHAIGITAGTTTWALARQLRDIPDLTVVTNSIRVAELLWAPERSDRVVLTGGIRTPSDALVGPVAVRAVRSLHLDLVFMGVHGMDEHAGFTTPNLMEAEVNRALTESAREVAVVADHTKWGLVGISSFATLDQADVLVTDSNLTPDARAVLEARIARVIMAPAEPGASRVS
ncbi:MAG: DeoR/GlpR family DNA-binding transcription regulator, partial [Micromonosporaceae bacterium]